MRETVAKRYAALGELIDLANLLSPTVDWPSPDEIRQRRETNSPLLLRTFWNAATQRFGRNIPPEFRAQAVRPGDAIVIGGPDRYLIFTSALELYAAVAWIDGALRRLATAPRGAWEAPIEVELPPLPSPRITITPSGEMLPQPPALADFFLSAIAGRDASRIKVCPIEFGGCGRLILAERKDREACGACAGRVRVKRFLDNNAGYYTVDRRKSRRLRREKKKKRK